ncbi:MAG: hypothetical protein KatS3mg015_0069 [Fimbriimonadales bacterium]|nr:MAG: hypothetical protein KatS3mg015_0069 [Fimbriimonadales bacterium]
MIQCPQCGNFVPPTFVRCQFCGRDLSNIARAVRGASSGTTAKEVFYYILAGLWVLFGLLGVVLGSLAYAGAFGEEAATEEMGLDFAVAVVQLLIGAGLLFQADWAIAIARVLCYITLALGVLGLICVWAAFDAVRLVLILLNITLAGLQLWVLSDF